MTSIKWLWLKTSALGNKLTSGKWWADKVLNTAAATVGLIYTAPHRLIHRKEYKRK